ncbi:polyhydroxyalkanoate depolymerase, partial [Variovorax sp. Sphag1AA]|nr:polyhydroxyalkanoate depolymerase [Variovorax sp. Sphag1AA]
DMDADYYLETIRTVFQEFDLVNGTWEVKSPEGAQELVRPQDIRSTGLLTIEGELDDISGAGQTRAAHDLCTGIVSEEQRHLEVKGAGHYGIFSGRRWREKVYPQVTAFILEHDQPQTRAPQSVLAQEDATPAPSRTKKRATSAAARKTASRPRTSARKSS